MKNTIHLMNCGGTIDKTHDSSWEIFLHKKTHLPQMIKEANIPEIEIKIEELFLKDSGLSDKINVSDVERKAMEMQEGDFDVLVKACVASSCDKVLIMHGTSSMIKSAKMLADKKLNKTKTIVFFGAMKPFELKDSDAMFNFGFALSAVQILPKGIFLAMNGRIFPHDKVRKNVKKAVFEEVE